MTRAAQAIARCREIAALTETPGRTTRTFLSPPMRDVHRLVGGWMEGLGMAVRVDAAGNLRGVSEAAVPLAPRLVVGSHLDTVPDAGAFDGVLGVTIGLALVEAQAGRRLPFAVEVVGFSEEEGVRFGTPFIGSKALVGELDAATLARPDAEGVTVREAIVRYGLDPDDLGGAHLADDVLGFLEFHIEQGPELERQDEAIALVSAIVGQIRASVVFTGQANHAGTTPMGYRRDAFASAAAWAVEVERLAQTIDGLVATVGTVAVRPGASNVIPGEATLSLDVRHAEDGIREDVFGRLLARAHEIARARGVELTHAITGRQDSVPMDDAMQARLAAAMARTGVRPIRMTSGAGHDAMILARHVPTAMLFLRSPGGLSHHPDETIFEADVEAAIRVGVEFLSSLA